MGTNSGQNVRFSEFHLELCEILHLIYINRVQFEQQSVLDFNQGPTFNVRTAPSLDTFTSRFKTRFYSLAYHVS